MKEISSRSSARLHSFLFLSFLLYLEWLIFCLGYRLQFPNENALKSVSILCSPALLTLFLGWVWLRRKNLPSFFDKILETNQIETVRENKILWQIGLASALSLFAELMMVRLHASYFQLFAFFKNLSLLSCFLGLGLGYVRGSQQKTSLVIVIPLFTLQILILFFLRHTNIELFLRNPVPEQLAFGLFPTRDLPQFMTTYGFLSFVFTLNALCFLPMGEWIGSLMQNVSQLKAYSWNLAGSLAGVVGFSILSFLTTPPVVWFFFFFVGILCSLPKSKLFAVQASAAAFLLTVLGTHFHFQQVDIYSPYQILTLRMQNLEDIPIQLRVSNTFFQNILNLKDDHVAGNPHLKDIAAYYAIPYQYRPHPENVLIVGSGTGNDVASAVRHQAKFIDAVEIDPSIYKVGFFLHPEQPYQAPNVHVHLNDARSFIRTTSQQYDLIIYGLLDSHSSLSGNSIVRLDSFVYTKEAFQEMKAKLKPDGLVCMAFSIGLGGNQSRIMKKLYIMLKETFPGAEPLIYKTSYDGGYTFLIGPNFSSQVLSDIPFPEISAELRSSPNNVDISTDDWPFLYMSKRAYPASYFNLILLLLVLSVVLIQTLSKGMSANFSRPCFFLGAGFMFLETKAITQLGLLYGNTWVVTAIVIVAILGLAFLSNWFWLRGLRLSQGIIYGALFLTLGIGFLATRPSHGLSYGMNRNLLPLIITLPVFFSGMAFSNQIKRSGSANSALCANIFGAMVGGFLEYHVMLLGFHALYFIAFLAYAGAWVSSGRFK